MNSFQEKSSRILVIDDNKSIHEDFRKILGGTREPGKLDSMEAALFGETETKHGLPTFQIDSAYQGQEGLELIERSLVENRPYTCLLYTSPSPRDRTRSRMPSSA